MNLELGFAFYKRWPDAPGAARARVRRKGNFTSQELLCLSPRYTSTLHIYIYIYIHIHIYIYTARLVPRENSVSEGRAERDQSQSDQEARLWSRSARPGLVYHYNTLIYIHYIISSNHNISCILLTIIIKLYNID